MGISIFPSTAAEFVSNNFVIDMNDTTNNTADTGGVKQAGPYSMSFSSGDISFDVYLIDEDGNSVGYSNNTSIVASGLFSTVVILGVAQDEVVSFLYQGSVNNADGEGDEPGAGAYLESISPSDLPSIDDTATVTGGNFGANTEIKFESGATVLDAKNIVVTNSTSLVVTRPDNLDAALDPWTLRAITTGVAQPTGTNANLLVDGVTAGAVPNWVTTSPLPDGTIGVAYSTTLEATDPDGDTVSYAVTTGSLPAGLSLNSTTGEISGTPTAGGSTFTVTATDAAGSNNSREFEITIPLATGGTVTTDANFTYHTFTSTDTFQVFTDLVDAQFLLIAGGASRGDSAGGGAGGLVNETTTISSGTYPVTIGAGGPGQNTNGNDSTFDTFTAIGGGTGGDPFDAQGGDGYDGGSGGGGSRSSGFNAGGTGLQPGSSTGGFGNNGGSFNNTTNQSAGGGGGGAGAAGGNASGNIGGNGGVGLQFQEYADASGLGENGYFAGGGGAYSSGPGQPTPGLGRGPNTGGGGGNWNTSPNEEDGYDGVFIVRYAV